MKKNRRNNSRPAAIATAKDTTKAIETRAGVLKEAEDVKKEAKTSFYLQYMGKEISTEEITQKVHEAWKTLGKNVDEIKTLNVYLKPEEVLLRPNVKFGEGTQVKNLEQLTLQAKIYFSLVKSVDDEIGRVLKVLDEEGLTDNTILIFTADHGEMMGSHGRMAKSVIYDESFSIPFFIRYPGQLKPGVNDLMLGATDIMPTLLGMMNLGDQLPETVKGKDYSQGILTGKYRKVKKPVSQFFYQQKEKGVRTDRYSYLVTGDGNYQLFDNLKDPYQIHSLKIEEIPSIQTKLLKKELGNWLKVSEDGWAKEHKFPDRITY